MTENQISQWKIVNKKIEKMCEIFPEELSLSQPNFLSQIENKPNQLGNYLDSANHEFLTISKQILLGKNWEEKWKNIEVIDKEIENSKFLLKKLKGRIKNFYNSKKVPILRNIRTANKAITANLLNSQKSKNQEIEIQNEIKISSKAESKNSREMFKDINISIKEYPEISKSGYGCTAFSSQGNFIMVKFGHGFFVYKDYYNLIYKSEDSESEESKLNFVHC